MKNVSEQLRDELLDTIRMYVRYWKNTQASQSEPALTLEDRLNGLAFSILCVLDGSGELPSFDLVAHVHPDNEDQTYEGVVISEMLHEFWYKD